MYSLKGDHRCGYSLQGIGCTDGVVTGGLWYVDPMQCGSVAQLSSSSHSLLLKVLWSQFGRWKN